MCLLHSIISCSSRSPILVIRHNYLIASLFHPLPANRIKTTLQQHRVCRTIKGDNYADKRTHAANIQKILPLPYSRRRIFQEKDTKKVIQSVFLYRSPISLYGTDIHI